MPEEFKIADEFIVDLRGKKYPVYAGVLDVATRMGLKILEVKHLQIPSEANGWMAVVQAIAVFEDGRTFTDLGDASPKNCSPQIATAALRMASTRAKGRVLRDAINCGMTLLEELPDENDTSPAAVAQREGGQVARPAQPRPAADRQPRQQPPAVRDENPLVGAEAGAPSCDHPGCGRELTRGEIASCEQAPMDGGLYCLNHAAQHVRENGTARRSAGQMECQNDGCSKPLTKGQHDISLRAYGRPLCPACQKTYTRIG